MAEKRKTVRCVCLVSRAGDRFAHSPGDTIDVDAAEYPRLVEAGHVRPLTRSEAADQVKE